MRLVATIFVLTTCVLMAAAAPAQVPQGVTVAFINKSNGPVIVKGYSIINKMQRPGQLLALNKGAKKFDGGVPVGIRYYTVYDYNNPARVLLRDFPVPIQNFDLSLQIAPSPTDPTRVVILPAGQ